MAENEMGDYFLISPEGMLRREHFLSSGSRQFFTQSNLFL